jgi:hypothetical protein
MQKRRIQKTNSNFVDTPGDCIRRQVNPYTQGFDYIRASAQARDAPVPMLRNPNAGAGNNKCGGRGDVESSGCISTRPAGVDQHLSIRAREGCGNNAPGPDRRSFFADDPGKSNKLVDTFTLHPERSQKCSYLRVRCFAGHNFVHNRFSFGAVQMPPLNNSSNSIHNVHIFEYIRITPECEAKVPGIQIDDWCSKIINGVSGFTRMNSGIPAD